MNSSGKEIFTEWFDNLRDTRTKAKIAARLARIVAGNFGDCKPLREGVWEMRIDWGPGYRVYYAFDGKAIVLLLCGGEKRRQSADIEKAIRFWNDYQKRNSI